MIFTMASAYRNNSNTQKWEFTDISTGQTCILVKFDGELNITYTTERKYLS